MAALRSLTLLLLLAALANGARELSGKEITRLDTDEGSSSLAGGHSRRLVWDVPSLQAAISDMQGLIDGMNENIAADPKWSTPARRERLAARQAKLENLKSKLADLQPKFEGGNCPDAQALLDFHNQLRARYGVAPLSWDTGLAVDAQNWANACAFQHSAPALAGQVGENIMMGWVPNCLSAAQGWANEEPLYNPNQWTYEAGHFWAMIYAANRIIGCGTTACGGDAARVMMVCRYQV